MPDQLINPYDLRPAEFARDQFLVAYWYLTWMRTIYEPDAGDWLEQLAAIAGTDSFEVFEQTVLEDFGEALGIIPRVEVIRVDPTRPFVHVRGSVTDYQIVQQIADWHFARFDPPVVTDPVMGEEESISYYHWARVPRVLEKLGGTNVPAAPPAWLQDGWVGVGHSLGGGMIGVMSLFAEPSIVCTAGSPREGNVGFAVARDDDVKLRFYNSNDLVPKAPPSAGGLNDWLAGSDPIGVITWQHWGRPWVLTPGVPPRPGTNLGWVGPEYFRQVFSGGQSDEIFFEHSPTEYCRRLRSWIPRAFPLDAPDVFYPGLFELDVIHNFLNASGQTARREVWGSEFQGGAITGGDLTGFLQLFQIPSWVFLDANAIYPFQCDDGEDL